MTDDHDLIVLESSWPGAMIQGEPGIVSGSMSVSGDPDGSVLLSLAVGEAGAGPRSATTSSSFFPQIRQTP
jgi:hypothetical protein